MNNELVICRTGERFETFGATNQGIEFDGGLILWNEIEGFMCWSAGLERWMFIPV